MAMNKEGASRWARITADNIGRPVAIVLDDQVYSYPTVNAEITGGRSEITGGFTPEEATDLANVLESGKMDAQPEVISQRVIGPSLGQESINKGLTSFIVALVLLMIFMICVYGVKAGNIANMGLLFNLFFTAGILASFQTVLTLPGIAGIVLALGMAVDANVIIFARIREELGTGKTLQSSVDIGFKKALSAILDGNITTLIASVVLMIMGTGSVKGFAQTLALGIVLSMITALFVTKALINGFIALGLKNEKLFGIAKKKKTVDFLSKGKIFAIISGVIIVAGIAAMVFFKVKTGNIMDYSLEFLGGTSTTATLTEDMSIEQIDETITPSIEQITGDGNVQITKVEGSNEIIVKTRTLTEDERNELSTLFTEEYNVDEGTITSETISATVSGEMRRNSIISVAVAVLCMLIYIWLRFSDYRFGVSSVLTLVHDVLVVLTFYAIARVSVSSTFIACMLTIVGYSINATIVIFDRIRENKKDAADKLRIAASRRRTKKKEDEESVTLKDIVNTSITQTLSRSVFTSLTTFVMVLMLYILGVTSIREFALPLMIGIACGCYSSVCLAGFIWYTMRARKSVAIDDEDDDPDKNYV